MEDKDNELEMSPLRLAAFQLHEMYTELRNAGFTKSEALTLVGKIVANGVGDALDNQDRPED
jgi:hypothetical protein